MSEITDEDIKILMLQGNISKNIAKELLILNNGELVESLVQLQSENFDLNELKKKVEIDEEPDDFLVDTSKQENLTKYREIVDSKDVIYNQKKKKKKKWKEKKEGLIDEEINFSIEDLYKLKRGKNTFNTIQVL